ncbi:MAG: LCP family protein [Acidimicrobiia bacterium]|nr:LCP family protein [Acidimicrobiia bacterium]
MQTRQMPKVPKSPPLMYAGDVPPSDPPVEPPRAKRRWARRLVVIVGTVAVLGAGWVALSAWLMSSSIERIPSSELLSLDATSSGPVNYLLVGSDSREDLPEELGGFFGDFAGKRTDVIMIAHVADGRLQLLSLPRDLKVDIPGHGVNRVNASFALGGPDLLVHTVKEYLDMPIHHYIEVGFGDFSNVVDQLGGVDIDFPYSARDNKSGLSVEAGTTHLDGPGAVAFVRSRSYEELRGGSWVGANQSDIGRIARQQLVLSRLMDAAKSPKSLVTAPWLGSGLGNSLTADEGLSMFDLAKLGWAVVRSGGIDTATLPVATSNEGGVSYVVPVEPQAASLLALFVNGGDMNPEPAQG